jgi:hypothetical protein
MMARPWAALALSATVALASCATTSESMYDRVTSNRDRISNTSAVQRCERQRPAVQCNELRAREIDRFVAHMKSEYEESPTVSLTQMIALSEGYGIAMARVKGVAYEPPGGRPYKAVDLIPSEEQKAMAEGSREFLRALGQAAGAYANAAAQAGAASGSSSRPIYQGTGARGPSCKPREVKPHDSTTCPG